LTRIFVGNLSYQTTEADLRIAFERFGKVLSVDMISDRMTGKSRGFAFVGMPHLDDADEAIAQLNGRALQGRPLVVSEAHGRAEPVHQPKASRWHLV